MSDRVYSKAIRDFSREVREMGTEIEPLPARFWEDEHWLFDHIAKLTRAYPEQWVAVYQKEVVGVGNSRQEAREQARAKVDTEEPFVVVRMESKTYVYPSGFAHS